MALAKTRLRWRTNFPCQVLEWQGNSLVTHYIYLEIILIALFHDVILGKRASEWVFGLSRDDKAVERGSSVEEPNHVAKKVHEKVPGEASRRREYFEMIPQMVSSFLRLTDRANELEWVKVVDRSEITVLRKLDSSLCFKVITTLDNTAATCFDILSDVSKRTSWDQTCEEGRVIEELDRNTRIVYVRTKPIWPTSGRDLVLLSHRRRLHDGRLINVTTSVTHHMCPELVGGKVIRMQAGIAGQICSSASLEIAGARCHLIQIADGDPKGWIPVSVIQFSTFVLYCNTSQSLTLLSSRDENGTPFFLEIKRNCARAPTNSGRLVVYQAILWGWRRS